MNWFQRQPNKPGPATTTPPDPRAFRGDGDALATAASNFLTKTGLFDREFYARTYADVAKSGLDPLHHYMRVGIHAGRAFTSVENIARLWREVLRESDAPPPQATGDLSRFRAAVYVSSAGNFFMTEIARVLMAGFADAGVAATLLDEKAKPLDGATHHIVVAPHEFFVLAEGRRWATDEFVSRAILFSTEQIQTQWFARSLAFLLRAKAVADMNGQNAAILRRAGIRAVAVQPGYTPSFAPFQPQQDVSRLEAFAGQSRAVREFDVTTPPLAARPLDVLFLGSASPRREKILAACAPKFAALNTFLYCTKMTRPLDAASSPTASSEVTAALLQRARVLVNIHRDDYTYFEWWRLMQAFWHRTLVVTEPCFPHPVFRAGEHYLEEAPRHIPHLVEWLVRSPEGEARAEEIRTRAFQTLVSSGTARSAVLTLLRAGEAA